MLAGITAYFARQTEPSLAPSAFVACLCLGLAWRIPARPLARAFLLCLGFAAGGFAAATFDTSRAPPWPDLPRRGTIVFGAITSVDILPEGRRITIATPALDGAPPLARGVRIRLRDTDSTPAATGDVVRVRALLRPPSPPAYPGGWDTQRDAWFSGMAGYGFAIGPITDRQAGPVQAIRSLRETVAARLLAALPGARGAIAATLFTGLGAAIPPDDRSAFQVSGLAHLLAVAGLHIGIVMGLIFGAVRGAMCLSEFAALHWPVKRIAALASLGAGLAYLELTGAHVPILRSFAMACLITLALLTGRRALSVRSLALAALVLMISAPDLVMGVSFQMSFAAVLALVSGWEVLSPRIAVLGTGTWWRTPVLYAGGLAVTSALAGTASLPYAAYHFGTATLFYVPANMLAVPLTAFWVMPLGLAALGLMPLHLESLATVPMGWGLAGMLRIAHFVAAWPASVLPVPRMPPWGSLLFSAGLAWLCLWRTRPRLAGLPAMAAGLLSPWLAAAPDLLVGPDATLVAARIGDQVFATTTGGASRFDWQIPVRVWGGGPPLPFATRPDGSLLCGDGACEFTLHATRVRVITRPAAACGDAAIVISVVALNGSCHAPLVVDRDSVAEDGATEIRLGPTGIVKTTDLGLRGDRPWVLPAQPYMATSRLPPAQTE